MKKNLIILFFSVLLFIQPVTNKASEKKDIEKLIEFNIAGTSIDIMPDHIHIIVDNPKKQIESYLKKRRIHKVKIPDTVSMFGTLVSFSKPSDYPHHAVGDVIYKFLMESEEEKNNFTDKYKLKFHAIRKGIYGYKYTEYVSQPGYYVTLGVKTKVYICKDHPENFEDKKGKCKKCGRVLTKEEIYR